ncbi:MAG: hypothetical protein FJW38_04075 [Acidobacteria bacterium]|nr:hypothetical protein [Acidobacteriota bacterium]
MSGLPEYLRGAADLHVHSAPDVVARRYDDIDLAREMAAAGFGAILLKSHSAPTSARAYLTRKVVPEIKVFGGLVLNDTIGGFNVSAVRAALAVGAKEIWMPTHSAHNHKVHHKEHGVLSVFDGHGELRHDVQSIVRLIANADAILGTGHISPEEASALIRFAHTEGVSKILVTHPEWGATYYTPALQRELTVFGAIFERCFVSTTHRCGHVPFATIENAIADVGVNSTILTSDLGQPDTPPPAEGMIEYAERMRAAGFTQDDVRRMMVTHPRHLLE